MGRAARLHKASQEAVALLLKILISSLMRGLPASLPSVLRLGAAAAAAGLLIGLAFAIWAEQSAGIFLALVDSGLSWCF